MSAQVTEAHRELARRIMFEFTQAGTATASDVRMAAQIIADSEAKATKRLRDEETARAERAEAKLNESRYETVKAAQEGLRECIRAERAEVELAKAKAILISIEEDGTEEHNAAVSLRQELAAERARLRQIALDACRSAKITPIVWYPKRYAIDPNDFGIINEQQVEACAQAIDAAMKEGA